MPCHYTRRRAVLSARDGTAAAHTARALAASSLPASLYALASSLCTVRGTTPAHARALLVVAALLVLLYTPIHAHEHHFSPLHSGMAKMVTVPSARPPVEQRTFISAAVEEEIERVSALIKNEDLATMFRNCYPNTLDTTVRYDAHDELPEGNEDTFIVTGDIQAMWLRDSTNQVLPYVDLAERDTHLQRMLRGLVNRQAKCILLDPYANAFNFEAEGSPWVTDTTYKLGFLGTQINGMTMKLHERKFELDSLCAFLRLSTRYYNATKDSTPFTRSGGEWLQAVEVVLSTMREQQKGMAEEQAQANPAYYFQRSSAVPTDASALPFPTAANAMAVVTLRDTATLLSGLFDASSKAGAIAASALELADEISSAISTHCKMNHTHAGEIYAYEVDGYGNGYFMDDANIPSLLSLPYLGFLDKSDPLYVRTREFVLGEWNPYYFDGSAGAGIGGPHVGYGYIWPMSLSMQALTSTDEEEIAKCIDLLVKSNAGTGFTHESFFMDSVDSYTRPWFAWSNSLFGELVREAAEHHPSVLQRAYGPECN